MGMSGAANQIVHNVGGKTDKSMHIHSHSPQLLNEMIEYADEHDIKRSRDMIVRKVITENGEVYSHFLSDSMIIVFFNRVHGRMESLLNSAKTTMLATHSKSQLLV